MPHTFDPPMVSKNELARLRKVDKAVHALLAGQIKQWNEGRLTVSRPLMETLRDAHRKPGEKVVEAYPLQKKRKGD